MRSISLERFCSCPINGVFGRMTVGDQVLYTVERPWLYNAVEVSCIPNGTYDCEKRFFIRGGYDTFEVTNVPGRTHILFHRGNTINDLKGCIAVGMRTGEFQGLWSVKNSVEGFRHFYENLEDEDAFRLRISGPCRIPTKGRVE